MAVQSAARLVINPVTRISGLSQSPFTGVTPPLVLAGLSTIRAPPSSHGCPSATRRYRPICAVRSLQPVRPAAPGRCPSPRAAQYTARQRATPQNKARRRASYLHGPAMWRTRWLRGADPLTWPAGPGTLPAAAAVFLVLGGRDRDGTVTVTRPVPNGPPWRTDQLSGSGGGGGGGGATLGAGNSAQPELHTD